MSYIKQLFQFSWGDLRQGYHKVHALLSRFLPVIYTYIRINFFLLINSLIKNEWKIYIYIFLIWWKS